MRRSGIGLCLLILVFFTSFLISSSIAEYAGLDLPNTGNVGIFKEFSDPLKIPGPLKENREIQRKIKNQQNTENSRDAGNPAHSSADQASDDDFSDPSIVSAGLPAEVAALLAASSGADQLEDFKLVQAMIKLELASRRDRELYRQQKQAELEYRQSWDFWFSTFWARNFPPSWPALAMSALAAAAIKIGQFVRKQREIIRNMQMIDKMK